LPAAENSIIAFITERKYIVLDGGMATALEADGFNLDDKLWSARVLLQNPDAIRNIHLAYLQAGADCITTASYQATVPGFRECGYSDDDAGKALRLSVELATEARDSFWSSPSDRKGRKRPLVAASVGPYGAYLADGSEYSGKYGLSEDQLREFHQERWQILASSKPDLMACETIPSRVEAAALFRLMAESPSTPSWISFSCRDGTHLWDGTPIAEVAGSCDSVPALAAIGINCTDPRFISSLIRKIRGCTSKPLLVYPNSGELYDPVSKTWSDATTGLDWDAAIKEWISLGAVGIGGCCRVGPERIARIRKRLLADQ
jgi:homocysteine S-methyltransferase